MLHNAKPLRGSTRLNIPSKSVLKFDKETNEAYEKRTRELIAITHKGVAARFLKLYTDDRAKKWASVYGAIINAMKETFSFASRWFSRTTPTTKTPKLSPVEITTYHDKLISEIRVLSTYESYIKLINTLNVGAIEAYESSSYRCLRTDMYFAIIQILQEAIRLLFPQEYAQDLADLHASYDRKQADYNARFDGGADIVAVYKEQQEIIIQLVLRGDSTVYKDAFVPDRTIFTYLADVQESEAGSHIAFLTDQFQKEEKRRQEISPEELINKNIPMPLQKYFVRLLAKLAFDVNRMEDLIENALDDKALLKGTTSLNYKYLNAKKSAQPQVTHEPPDQDDLLKDSESPDGSPVRAQADNEDNNQQDASFNLGVEDNNPVVTRLDDAPVNIIEQHEDIDASPPRNSLSASR